MIVIRFADTFGFVYGFELIQALIDVSLQLQTRTKEFPNPTDKLEQAEEADATKQPKSYPYKVVRN